MFLDEARLVARLNHENLVQVYELVQIEGQYCLVMEYIVGADVAELLERCLERNRPFPIAIAAHIAAEVAEGLHHAHELRDDHGRPLGVVHRDVSPANIILTAQGAVKVVDFGVAAHATQHFETAVGVIKGKTSYMSPEQIRDEPLDRRTDLFALGAVLYELLTLLRCFRRDTAHETLQAILRCEYLPVREVRPEVPDALVAVLDRLLAAEVHDRYATAADAAADLGRVLTALHLPTAAEVAAFVDSLLVEGTKVQWRGFSHFGDTRPIAAAEALAAPTVAVRIGAAGAGAGRPGAADATIPLDEPVEPDATRSSHRVVASAPDRSPRAAAAVATPTPLPDTDPDAGPATSPAPLPDTDPDAGPATPPAPLPSTGSITAPDASRTPMRPWLIGGAAITVGFALAFGASLCVGSLRPSREPPSPTAAAQPPERLGMPEASAPLLATPSPPIEPRTEPPPVATDAPLRAADTSAAAPVPAVSVGRLALSSTPSTEVHLDGTAAGRTPVEMRVAAGVHQVAFSDPGLGIARRLSVRVSATGVTRRHVEFEKGKLAVNVDPWAMVYLRGELLGQTPLVREVYEGNHEIELVNPETGRRARLNRRVAAGQSTKIDRWPDAGATRAE
jgi:serine/threonine-protein kinase